MAAALTTVVVVPRERFSHSIKTLHSILENTGQGFELLIVDGNSPPPIRDEIRSLAEKHDFKLLRSENYLTPTRPAILAGPLQRPSMWHS